MNKKLNKTFNTISGKNKTVHIYNHGKIKKSDKLETLWFSPEKLTYHFYQHIDEELDKVVYSYLALVGIESNNKSEIVFVDYSGKFFKSELKNIINIW